MSPSDLSSLNPAQRAAVEFDVTPGGAAVPGRPLLIIAGAGSGKTRTLAHRVAHLILNGVDPGRILLLTFTRRAAEEMTRRVERICGQTVNGGRGIAWSGTFHAIGHQLLRLYAGQIGLDPRFTVLDRADAADLLDLVRDEQGLSIRERCGSPAELFAQHCVRIPLHHHSRRILRRPPGGTRTARPTLR
jgi:DNA helicase-2/ATP-dependent DNA helicase PcrA